MLVPPNLGVEIVSVTCLPVSLMSSWLLAHSPWDLGIQDLRLLIRHMETPSVFAFCPQRHR